MNNYTDDRWTNQFWEEQWACKTRLVYCIYDSHCVLLRVNVASSNGNPAFRVFRINKTLFDAEKSGQLSFSRKIVKKPEKGQKNKIDRLSSPYIEKKKQKEKRTFEK